jgi:perosamine synthetase
MSFDLNPMVKVSSQRKVPVAAPVIGHRELEYVTDAVRSEWVSSLGPYIERFESAFAAYVGVKHAISVASGTAALHLALRALGIGPGDEVIVPDLTFVATANMVLLAGASPVLVDVEPDTWCLDPIAVERAISPRTRAIIPVHLYGHPANMDLLLSIAKERGLMVVEDAAEAHGAKWRGRMVGSLGRVGAFSFYGNKLITTGEGGMLTTDDSELALRIRHLKDHGMSSNRRYFHTELAFNYRMTNIQAALGLAQLEQIETFIERKRQIYYWYREELGQIPCLRLNPECHTHGYRNVFWMICVVLAKDLSDTRDALCQRLKSFGIDTRPFFVPMHELPFLEKCRTVGREGDRCVVSSMLSRQGFNLPSGAGLDEDTVRWVGSTVRSLLTR